MNPTNSSEVPIQEQKLCGKTGLKSYVDLEREVTELTLLNHSQGSIIFNQQQEILTGKQRITSLEQENWTASLIDRLNELVRENRSEFYEVTNGHQASELIQNIHGNYNSLKQQLKESQERNRELVEGLSKLRALTPMPPIAITWEQGVEILNEVQRFFLWN